MKFDWLNGLRRQKRFGTFKSRMNRRRQRTRKFTSYAVEALEARVLLSVSTVSLVTDANVLFETDDQSMFGPGSGATISESVDLTLLDIDINRSKIGGFIGGGTGAEITIHNGNITLGLRASVDINPGQVDVDYQADMKIFAEGTKNITAGQVFTINTSQIVDTAIMVTDFPDITARLSTFVDIDVQIDVLAKLFGETLLDTSIVADTGGEDVGEIISISIGQNDAITVGFGGVAEVELAEEGIDLDIVPEPLDDFLSVGLFVPELDTSPGDDSSVFVLRDGIIINSKLTNLEKANTGETDIDFLKIGLDLDALASAIASGGTNTDGFGIKLDAGNFGSLEVFLLSAEFQNFFGIGQLMTFQPNLMVNLQFSQPTMVEIAPGMFSEVTSTLVAVGDSIDVIHPGGDLTIDTTYTLAENTFRNITDFRYRPALNIRFLGYDVSGTVGVAFDTLGIPRSNEVFHDTFSPKLPIRLGGIFDDSYSLVGFQDVAGGSLILPSLSAPELTLDTVTAINEDSRATLSGTITDLNSGDFPKIVIDWGDGRALQTIQFPDPDDLSPDPLPARVTWNANTGEFTVLHRYLDDGASGSQGHTYTITVQAEDSTGLTSQTRTRNVRVRNARPTVSLSTLAPINENGTTTLTGSFSDPGRLDTFSLTVDWADPNNTAASTFALGTISSLNSGQTINSSTDGAVLTLTNVDAGTDTVTFSVQHQFLDDGLAPGNGTTFDTSRIVVTVTDDDTGLGSRARTQRVNNVTPTATLNSVANVNGTATVTGSFSDPGTLDEFSLLIDWADPNNTTDSTFALGTISSLSANQTISSSTDSAVMTLTNVDVTTGVVTFSVQILNSDSVDSSVAVTVVDDDTGSHTATGANSGPVAVADTNATTENASVVTDVIANDTDADTGEVLSLVPTSLGIVLMIRDSDNVAVAVSTASVSQSGNQVTFDPGDDFDFLAAGETATVVIQYAVTDDNASPLTDNGTLTISVTGTNDGPVAVADANATTENASVATDVIANDTDVDTGDVLSLVPTSSSIVSMKRDSDNAAIAVSTASVSQSGNQITFDPDTDFDFLASGETATVVIQYTVTDDDASPLTDTGTLTITVTGINRPNAVADTNATTENANVATDVIANDTDPDISDVLSLVGGSSSIASMTIDSSSLAITVSTATVSESGNQITFDPGTDFDFLATGETATVAIHYTVTDDGASPLTDNGTLTITVTGTNDGPVVSAPVDVSSNEDAGTFSLDLLAASNAADADATDVLTVSSLTLTSGRAISFTQNGNNLEFDANQFNDLAVGDSETLVFAFSVSDDSGTSNDTVSSTVTVLVAGRNDAPVVESISRTTNEDAGTFSLNLLTASEAADVDAADVLAISDVSLAIGRAISFTQNGGILEFDTSQFNDLAVGESETLVFAFSVSDDSGAINNTTSRTVTILVEGRNDGPAVLAPVVVVSNEDADFFSVDLLAGANDPDLSDLLEVADLTLVDGIEASGVTATRLFIDANDYNHLAVGESAVIVYNYNIIDSNGGSVAQTVTITIEGRNDGPTVSATNATVTVNEGNTATNNGSFSDDDLSDIVSITSSVGSITQNTGNIGYWVWSFDTSDGPIESQTVTITATDSQDATATQTFQLTVNNVAPTLTMNTDAVVINEGTTANKSISASDVPADTVSVIASLGTISDDGDGGWTWSYNATDDLDTTPVTITATDEDGGETTASFNLTVNNVAPTVSITTGPTAIVEGDTVTVAGTFTDPALGIATETFTGTALWSDGVTTAVTILGGTFRTSRTFTDDDPTGTSSDTFTVAITITDDDGGSHTQTSPTITVNNVAPDNLLINDADISTYVIAVGESATFTGSFTDVGIDDTHTAVWKFESGNVSLNPDGSVTQGIGSGTVSNSFSFTEAGVYTVTLTITDDDTGATTSDSSMFVVYDPSAGFVTGGGWFMSPEGAYAGTSLTGKANFGFVAKYKKGGTTLTGQTEFQFKAGDLNFHSDEYIWLVIAGARAQYQGTGTINGSGNYGFKLTAIDGQVSGGGGYDKIRLKIWDKDNNDDIVYDSGLGVSDDEDPSIELGGGKIVIHSKGNALQAAGGAFIGGTAVQSLSYTTLQPVVNQAIENWAIAGADASQLNALSQIDVHLANLSGSYLGMASASSNLIWIDVDAAGYGWGSDGMDLLSAVSHELGHQIGMDHDEMGATLALSSRYLVSSGLTTETRRSESPESGFSLYDDAENRTSSNSAKADSEQIGVDILESLSIERVLSDLWKEEEKDEDTAENASEAVLVEDDAADDLFADFNESLLDELLAV